MNINTNDIEQLLPGKEVAARLRTCTRTLRRMVDRGELREVRFSSKCIRYSVADVAAALESKRGERMAS
jgi:excisionase family DNA binding protein